MGNFENYKLKAHLWYTVLDGQIIVLIGKNPLTMLYLWNLDEDLFLFPEVAKSRMIEMPKSQEVILPSNLSSTMKC